MEEHSMEKSLDSFGDGEDDSDQLGRMSDDEPPSIFFADATLDLEEAHGIAETPEPRKLLKKPEGPLLAPTVPPLANNMNRIVSSSANNTPTPISNTQFSSRRPKWPRDASCSASFVILVPLSILWPICKRKTAWMATDEAAENAVLRSLVLTLVAGAVLTRLFYHTLGGGNGDDARHLCHQIIAACATLQLVVNVLLVLALYNLGCVGLALLVSIVWVRDLVILKTTTSQQAFFQVLMGMALDILARSLKRGTFHRAVQSLVVLQFLLLYLWRWAILGSLSSSKLLLILTLVGGKWATGVVTRLLGLVASGGIASWMEQQQQQQQQQQQTPLEPRQISEQELAPVDTASSTIPEAYRTVDASVYESVNHGIDENYQEEDEDDLGDQALRWAMQEQPTIPEPTQEYTVKAFLLAGLGVSFGSVVRCGLLGGMAQFVWSQLRKANAATVAVNGFRGMPIAGEETAARKLYQTVNGMARSFVHSHTDMALSHVALYRKSYQKAAHDVIALLDRSGVEPIVHEDITTHMSGCVAGAVSGVIVLLAGYILDHVQSRLPASQQVKDSSIVADMVLAYVLCYILILTVMEPLRASIKAVYVSFAEHPTSLSQSFPIIFHRLSRMSEANLS